jgi:hypothetical protein
MTMVRGSIWQRRPLRSLCRDKKKAQAIRLSSSVYQTFSSEARGWDFVDRQLARLTPPTKTPLSGPCRSPTFVGAKQAPEIQGREVADLKTLQYDTNLNKICTLYLCLSYCLPSSRAGAFVLEMPDRELDIIGPPLRTLPPLVANPKKIRFGTIGLGMDLPRLVWSHECQVFSSQASNLSTPLDKRPPKLKVFPTAETPHRRTPV